MEEINLKLTLKKQKSKKWPASSMVASTYNPSTRYAEAREQNCFESETSLDYKVSSRSACAM